MLVEQVVWRTLRGDTRALRTRLGLRPQDHPTARVRAARGMVELQAYSPLLVPDLVDYGSQRPLIGFLTPDAALRADLGEAEPDPGLEAWLAAGDPPVYFGFGSMPVLDPVALTAVITGVARRLGVRALISAGWSALGSGQAPDPAVRVWSAPSTMPGSCPAALWRCTTAGRAPRQPPWPPGCPRLCVRSSPINRSGARAWSVWVSAPIAGSSTWTPRRWRPACANC
jgi:hypothetical protein